MNFYADPAFFILAAISVVPAVFLGVREKSMAGYGLAVSCAFLVLLFMYDVAQGVAFLVTLVLSVVLCKWVLHLFKTDSPQAVLLYRLALIIGAAPLVIYKVASVFDSNLLGFIGISYLTFKLLQMLIEIRDGLIKELSVFDCLYFLVFFTPFTSGPILRSRPFVDQAHNPLPRGEYLDGLSTGALRFILGALYKFVFAALASWTMWFVPELIGGASVPQKIGAELCISLFYGLYLFFDFAGYSLMAMGLGSAFGIQVPRNFNLPFAAIDIKDFWNRWHITLSHWLRDFVFMRFTRACMMHKVFKSRTTTACMGYLLNMTIMGMWHGLTIDYIAYGVYHGILLALCELFQKKSKFYKAHKDSTAFKVASWAVTIVAVFFGFSLFSGQISRLVLGA